MPKLIQIYWRDIPSQVIAKAGRKSAKVMLPDRFQVAIDRAAMRAGKGTSDAYMEDWTRSQKTVAGDIDEIAKKVADELDASFSEEKLEQLTKAKGLLQNLTSGDSCEITVLKNSSESPPDASDGNC